MGFKVRAASMSFIVRPFARCIEAFRASNPGRRLRESAGEHNDTRTALSFDELGDWPDAPPITSLYLQKDPFRFSRKVLSDAKTLVAYANFGSAVGTWNAHGSGQSCSAPDAWLIADVELVQEQAGDDYFDPTGYVSVIFAIWRVQEGLACAVWEPVLRDVLAQVIGLPRWPSSGWQPITVWYGE